MYFHWFWLHIYSLPVEWLIHVCTDRLLLLSYFMLVKGGMAGCTTCMTRHQWKSPSMISAVSLHILVLALYLRPTYTNQTLCPLSRSTQPSTGKSHSLAHKTLTYETLSRRQRGFKVGSLRTGENDKDNYYIQKGHPLHPEAFTSEGRYKVTN
jgi:hypothetical protein